MGGVVNDRTELLSQPISCPKMGAQGPTPILATKPILDIPA